jgi:hypothetical protein
MNAFLAKTLVQANAEKKEEDKKINAIEKQLVNYKKLHFNMAQTKNIHIDMTGKKILMGADKVEDDVSSSEGPEESGGY